MAVPVDTALIGVDVTLRSMRLIAFDDDGEVIERHVLGPIQRDSTDGVASALAGLYGVIGDVPVIICGVSTTTELQVPFLLDSLRENLTEQSGMFLVPGLKQLSPPDLMRGVETRLAGLQDEVGAICFPGEHTRHVTLEFGRVLDFTTEITGEMQRRLLAEGSLATPFGVEQVFDERIFRDWVERSLDTDDSPSIYAVRAARLIGLLKPQHHAAAVSGLLIGADVAAHYDPGDDVILATDSELGPAYELALDALGADVEPFSADEAAEDGLFEIAELAGLLGQ